jgi:hypothetical protein
MAIAKDYPLKEGDVVSIQATVLPRYGDDEDGKIFVKLIGHYERHFISREHLTFVRPHVEPGMLCSLGAHPQEYDVLALVEEEWVVVRARGKLAESIPDPMVAQTITIERAWWPKDEDTKERLPPEDQEGSTVYDPPPPAPEPLRTDEHAGELLGLSDETAEMEPRRTSLHHGYPRHQSGGVDDVQF